MDISQVLGFWDKARKPLPPNFQQQVSQILKKLPDNHRTATLPADLLALKTVFDELQKIKNKVGKQAEGDINTMAGAVRERYLKVEQLQKAVKAGLNRIVETGEAFLKEPGQAELNEFKREVAQYSQLATQLDGPEFQAVPKKVAALAEQILKQLPPAHKNWGEFDRLADAILKNTNQMKLQLAKYANWRV